MARQIFKAGIMLATISLCGCKELTGLERANGPTSANTPREMFVHLLVDPVPTGVTQLEGVGDTWQGYRIYLRFNADKTVLASILATGFEQTSCADIKDRFDLPNGYDQFSSPWNPHTMTEAECYEADVSNDWTSSGSHSLIADPEATTVYFYGIGI
ncbi:MAG: hypothetical protein AB4040_00540 [Synechococcus sp.]